MADAIISRKSIQQKGAAAFLRGVKRDEHGMNPWAPALYDWHLGYDRAATESQYAATAQRGVDIAQVSA